jgi:hypothetical protein
MGNRVGGAVLLLLVGPSLVFGQSLGEAARKEQERRKKNKQAGVQAKVITEEDLRSGSPEAATKEVEAQPDAPAPQPAATEPEVSSGEPDRAAQEQRWRARAAAARADVARAEAAVKELSQLSLVEGEYYVDDQGNKVIRNLAHLRELVAKADADLARARQALANLEEEARRSGALPGWLR